MAFSARLRRGDLNGPFAAWRKHSEQRMERGALIATDRAATTGKNQISAEMQAAGLGGLSRAIGARSDLKTGRGVTRRPGGGFSASGMIYIRSRSARTRGAIQAYTEGATITPKRSRWLWYPSDEILRVAGKGSSRQRVTPGNWQKFGLDRKIGPLVRVQGSKGPLLIVRNVGVSLAGKSRSARSLTKKGKPYKGQMAMPMIVAFIGIPSTTRAARVDALSRFRAIQRELPQLYLQAMGAQ